MIEQTTVIAAREIIGRHFKEIREEKGLSIYAVSKASGLTYDQVAAVECGQKDYTIGTFLRMCHALNLYFYMADKPEGAGHDLEALVKGGVANYPDKQQNK